MDIKKITISRLEQLKLSKLKNLKEKSKKKHKPKKKIALCLSGYIGAGFSKTVNIDQSKKYDLLNLELSVKHIFHDIINKNKKYEFDIFIHSWNDSIKNELIESFKPKKYYIEKNTFNNGANFSAQLSRLLGVKIILNLLNDYIQENSIKYEQVILTRYDLILLNHFPIKNYINNNIKIFEGFNRGDWISNHKKYYYSLELYKKINNSLTTMKLKVSKDNFPNFTGKIIEILFMSSFDNIFKMSKYYDILLSASKNNDFTHNPHNLYFNILIDILKGTENKIELIKEIYYEGLNEFDKIPSTSTLLLQKQMYYRNPGCNFKYGTIIGEIKGRLFNVENIMKKYKIPLEIILKCI